MNAEHEGFTPYKTLDDVRLAYASMPLSHARAVREWTLDEIGVLRVFCMTHRYDDIAKALKRSKGSVNVKAWKLGIHKHPHWSDKELEALAQSKDLPTARSTIKRSPEAVDTKYYAMFSRGRRCATKE